MFESIKTKLFFDKNCHRIMKKINCISAAEADPEGFGGPGAGDVGPSGDSDYFDFGGVGSTGMDLEGVTETSVMESLKEAAKGALKGVPSIFGMVLGGVKSFRESQISQVTENVKANNPDMSEEEAREQAVNALGRAAQSNTTGMSPEEAGDYISRNRDQIVKDANVLASGDLSTITRAYPEESRLWDDFMDRWFAKKDNVEALVLADAAFKRKAGEQFAETLTSAQNRQSKIINDIIRQAQRGRGIYKPTTFTIQGQPVSFLNRGARSTGQFLTDLGQQKFENIGSTAERILATAGIGSPEAGKLDFLDKLARIAGTEEARRATRVDEALAEERTRRGLDIERAKIEMQEPSFLQKAGQIAEVGKGIYDLYSAFGD
jgi:hypothetical protein